MSAFVDTSAIYALLVRSEEGHPATVAAFRSLVESGQGLFTTSYVLVEAVALLQHRLGLDPIRDLEEAIVPLLAVEWVAAPLHRLGPAQARPTGLRLGECSANSTSGDARSRASRSSGAASPHSTV